MICPLYIRQARCELGEAAESAVFFEGFIVDGALILVEEFHEDAEDEAETFLCLCSLFIYEK